MRNEIRGLIKGRKQNMEGETVILYDISSKQNLTMLYERKSMNFSEVKDFFYAWRDAALEAERYLLNTAFLVCNPEYIYCNISTKQTCWLFYPTDREADYPEDLNLLSEFLLEKVDHKDADAVDVVYRFYRNVKEDGFLITDIIEMIESVKTRVSNTNETEDHESYIREEFGTEEKTQSQDTVLKKIGKIFSGFNLKKENREKTEEVRQYPLKNTGDELRAPLWQEEKAEEEEMTRETVLIAVRGEERRELKCVCDGKVYPLEKFPVFIGKLKSEVDICIEDESVSRIHAKFFELSGKVWMEDLNSRNGCSINEINLESYEKVELSSGDRIRIGSVDFIYN